MSIHPRRRPPKEGTIRSINGAHKNFNVYGSPTRPKNPIVVNSRPSSRIQNLSVEPVSKSGRPEEKPVKSMISILGPKRRVKKFPSQEDGWLGVFVVMTLSVKAKI